MRNRFGALALLAAAALGCACGAEEETYSVSVEVVLTPTDNDELHFMTASGTVIPMQAADFRGEPMHVAVYEGGALGTLEAPLERTWTEVPDDLRYTFTTETQLESGPYDISVIIYAGTPITEEMKSGFPGELPLPRSGDVTSFSLDTSVIYEGDPDFEPGMMRLNLSADERSITVENRTSAEDAPYEERFASLTNTFLTQP